MKLNEVIIYEDLEKLDEIKLKHALAGAALAGAVAAGTAHHIDTEKNKATIAAAEKKSKEADIAKTAADKARKEAEEEKKRAEDLVKKVLDKYSVSDSLAKKVVDLAIKNERDVFPKAEDLLAVIGIESSFNPIAKSGLKKDKAIGLTQIRPHVWGIPVKELRGNIAKQIEVAADILEEYHEKLGNKDKAIHAYNVGLTNVRHGKGLNPEYVRKWKTELKRYET